jgi:hypothetical protein
MKTPIALPVRSVRVRHYAEGEWSADVRFGMSGGGHDDPTITVKSGEGLAKPPQAGDVLMVRPPEVLGYADGAGERMPTLTANFFNEAAGLAINHANGQVLYVDTGDLEELCRDLAKLIWRVEANAIDEARDQ